LQILCPVDSCSKTEAQFAEEHCWLYSAFAALLSSIQFESLSINEILVSSELCFKMYSVSKILFCIPISGASHNCEVALPASCAIENVRTFTYTISS
jgi:hypothetical protein